ncbi:hypothetical protein PS834_00996 [Pseudomonas fluorescens]|nr:hypothetical protein PS834_00996 [Pseudomonas fluorescens]
MSIPFAEQLPLPAGNGTIRLWLKSSAYTRRLLQGTADADVWTSAASFLAWFSQSHSLLKPQVAVLEVGELFDTWIARSGGLESRLAKRRRPTTALRSLLAEEEPKTLLAEVIDAVDSHLRGRVPLVLAMPSPRHWLGHANRLANQPDETPDADTVEDASIYLADLLRSVSTKPVSGVLLEEAAADSTFSRADLQRYSSVVNVARHYRWSLGLRLPPGTPVPESGLEDFDVVITEGEARAGLYSRGRDISAEFTHRLPRPLADGEFYFVSVNPELHPETVLQTLELLRRRA